MSAPKPGPDAGVTGPIPDTKPTFGAQPAKGAYLTYVALSTLARLPFWTLYYLPAGNRQKSTWPLKRAIIRQIMGLLLGVQHSVGPLGKDPTHRELITTPISGVRYKGVWIPALPEGIIIGRVKEWAEEASVETSISIPGYWVAGPTWPQDKEVDARQEPTTGARRRVLVYFHTGCYAQMSAHPSNTSATSWRSILSDVTPEAGVARAFAIEYRKSQPQRGEEKAISFPAALIDAVTAYHYLVHDIGIAPEDVIFYGDSSGGNQVLAAARYLVEYRDQLSHTLPPPGHCIIHSSYADMGHSDYSHPDSSIFTSRTTDFYTPEDLIGQRSWFLGPFGVDGPSGSRNNPYISPASEVPSVADTISFKGFPRTLNIMGGSEILRDQNRVLNERMKRDMGEGPKGVTYVEFPDAVHDFLMMEWHEPERHEAIKLIDEWLKNA